MTKWNKKTSVQLKDAPYRPEDHGYGQLNKSLQRYNATLGCFEEVPRPGGVSDGLEAGQDGAPPRKSRMKVMIKPYTNEAGEEIAAPGLAAPLPVQQRVARYEEVVEDDGQVVVHVPDSAAGPDGIIRLLQVTNEDGSVHYISADHTEIEEDFTMEDAMQMILTEVDHIAEHVTEDTQPIVIQNMEAEQAEQAVAAAEQEAMSVKDEVEDADLVEVSGACYVCGETVTPDDAPMTPLMAGRSRHTVTALAELLADTVQRELTVSTADGVCAACLTLLDQCDQSEGPLRKSASRHVRNVLAVRVGDLSAVEGAAGDTKRKRGRSRVCRPAESGQDGLWTDPGASNDPQWTPFLDVPARKRAVRKPRETQTGSPTPEEPKLEHLTDLTVPSETKRSARIAIRKNAYVANAVHASNRPRVLVVPDMQTKYLADPRPQRRPYRRLNMNPAKGRRGRPKLPNPPENEPDNLVTVDSEVTEKPPDVEPDPPGPAAAAAAEEAEVGAETAPGQTAEQLEEELSAGTEAGQLLVEESGTSQTADESSSSAAAAVTEESAQDPAAPEGRREPELIYVDLHEDLAWQAAAGCSCIMCTELTEEQRARLEDDIEFCTTYVCQVCDTELMGRKKYIRHETNCRQRQRNPRRRQPIIHECNTCQRTFKSARLRNEHYTRSGHEKRSPCPVCHKFFHPDFLRIHLSSHSGAFLCRVCNTHFSSNATLRGHMYRHSGLKPHKCDVCSASFRTPSSLFMHKRYHHSDDRPYVCNFCPKGFAARSTLKIHLRQHTGERPFECKLCPKTYARKSSLTQHLRSHTQERRHACMTCGKRFDNKTYLKVHMNRHLGIRAHPCGRCGRGFYSRPNLLKHMQVLCYKEDYGRPEEEQLRRTRELQAAAQQQLEQAEQQFQTDGIEQHVVQDPNDLQMHTVEMDDDDIQTTEVILAIESIPENGELLVGHMVH